MPTDREVLVQIQPLVNQIKTLVDTQLQVIPPGTHVPAGSDLQAAINTAKAGDLLIVDPGDYAPITVSKPLTLTSSATLPGRRILGTDDPGLFVRILSTGQPALSLAAPAALAGFRFSRTDINPPIVDIAGDWTGGSAVLDQCWVLAQANGNRRGIFANGWATTISRCRVENIWFQGQDSQAIGSSIGPGPLTIDDCYLEGATETVLIGGSDPPDQAHSPKNFTLRKSTLTKRLAWKSTPGLVKNALEFKNCVGFLVEDNVIEYSWVDAQVGYLLVLTPRNQDGGAPYSNVANGVIQRNLFRHGAGGINMLGTDNDNPSGRMTGIKIQNNRFEDIDGVAWGANGKLCQIITGPDQVTLDHNDFVGQNLNSFLAFGNFGDTLRTTGLVYTNNVACEGDYGLFGDTVGVGVPALDYFAPGVSWGGVAVIRQAPRTVSYPPGTVLISSEAERPAGAGASGYPTGV